MSPVPPILLGTCSWTANGWKPAFYPRATQQSAYMEYYARHFPTVEIDSTFYAIPPASTVASWAKRTPPGFVFSAKMTRVVTHEKVLVDALPDVNDFCRSMEALGDRLGPLLLQFPYFRRSDFSTGEVFLARLRPFLAGLPTSFRWALEIRNRGWLNDSLLDCLRSHQVAFALIDHPYMPRPEELNNPGRLITAPFSYVRWLGDRHKIEEQTSTWDRTIVDRTADLRRWVDLLQELMPSVGRVYAYANNHYAGHSPATLRDFNRLWGGDLLHELPDIEEQQALPLL
ncbi:MAG: DUF72 domain-containing protein [Chloroflexi bacterium]|nr:DUF72 domain-containing protein [Chloroflexota bacterium]